MTLSRFSILGAASVVPATDGSWSAEIPAAMKRRDPRIWHMAHVAAARAISKNSARPVSIVAATALGALDETKNFLDGIYTDGFGSPKNFIASVHNGMAGKLAVDLKIPGPNLTVCDGANSFASAIAVCGLLSDADYPVLVVAVDESVELLDRLRPHLSPQCQNVIVNKGQEGALSFVLGNAPAVGHPSIGATSSRYIGDADPEEAFWCQVSNTKNQARIIAPRENGGGYIASAIRAYQCFFDAQPVRCLIGSFSPSSKSIAVVDVCP